jgi:hypothetical protein
MPALFAAKGKKGADQQDKRRRTYSHKLNIHQDCLALIFRSASLDAVSDGNMPMADFKGLQGAVNCSLPNPPRVVCGVPLRVRGASFFSVIFYYGSGNSACNPLPQESFAVAEQYFTYKIATWNRKNAAAALRCTPSTASRIEIFLPLTLAHRVQQGLASPAHDRV